VKIDPPSPSLLRGKQFFAELKRRNVYKVAVAYAVVGWLIAQIATQIFPFLEIPNWVVRLVIVLIAIGFPIALVIAWAFEATPEGIKRTEDVDPAAVSRAPKKHAWIYVVVIGAAISAALFFLGRYTARSPAGASSELPAKSIAVLPFDNLSRDPDNAFFTEGVQDEILTRLAKVADLKVIARTSTQKFKSSPENLSDIAKQLGALNILEGSVQKANDKVRVNVQLINAMTNVHLWAEIYDRKLTDIFSVESDIAKTIADTLQAKLSGSEKTSIAKAPTANPEAYELYLKGRFFWNKRTPADLQKAADYYNKAIAKDPNYALAYAGLAEAYVLFPDYGVASPAESVPRAKTAATEALRLDPALAEPHAALGIIYSYYEYDFAKSIAQFERAIELNPNYATAHQWINSALQASGQFDRAIAETKRGIELDPLSLIINSDLAFTYLMAHRFDEALEQSRKTLEMDPGFSVARGYLAEALQFKGQLPEAIEEFRKAARITDQSSSFAQLGQACARAGQREEAQQILARLLEKSRTQYVSGWVIAVIYVGLGDKAHALDALENAYNQHASELPLIKYDPYLDDLHGDPRFEALVQKVIAPKL
jgi:TolB-like protein/Tfp pilus assembly protein PilF